MTHKRSRRKKVDLNDFIVRCIVRRFITSSGIRRRWVPIPVLYIIALTPFSLQDAPINVGWGSKQTQFHGSLGKTAAQAPKNVKVGSSPDDDNAPRISWRGDGTYFVVSSLADADEHGLRQRTLRVYDRNGALQSTSEPVAGLEHTLAWRPSGNLIAGTQRFGFEGGGAGRESRHDVVFFERNGLRHGEFTLNPDCFLPKAGKDTTYELKWGYRVRDLLWNSDSSVLAVWAESSLGDVGRFRLIWLANMN